MATNIPSTEGSQNGPVMSEALHIAALNGDWETASGYFHRDPNTFALKLTPAFGDQTILQSAITASQWQFVDKLVQLTPPEALAIQDLAGATALHYAALAGNIETAKALVNKNPSLPNIPDFNGLTPLIGAVRGNNKDMVWYLLLITMVDSPRFASTVGTLMMDLTGKGYHDITLSLVRRYPSFALAVHGYGWNGILDALVQMPSEFLSSSKLGFFERCIYQFVPVELNHLVPSHLRGEITPNERNLLLPSQTQGSAWNTMGKLVPGVQRTRDTKLRHKCAIELIDIVCSKASTLNDLQLKGLIVHVNYLKTAIHWGPFEFIKIYLKYFPHLLYVMGGHESLMHDAIRSRQEKIFRYFLRKYPFSRNFLRFRGPSNLTTSHVVAKLTSSPEIASISGAAFQMQKELQWFKKVEKLDQSWHKNERNNALGKIPWDVFREEHRDMLKEGEKWMKDTSNSCMLVATLVATVVFAAAFTVPGGNNQDNGTPIFLQSNTFMVFAASDAVALFSSITSLLMFLSILTARYAEEDFLKTLPKRLILGLASLFIAIAATMVAFGAALSLVLGTRLKWVSFPIILFASIPIALFALLQLPLFIQMVQSTYGSSSFE